MLHKYAQARNELETAPQPQLCFLLHIISSISHKSQVRVNIIVCFRTQIEETGLKII